jgi:hypothetical protein
MRSAQVGFDVLHLSLLPAAREISDSVLLKRTPDFPDPSIHPINRSNPPFPKNHKVAVGKRKDNQHQRPP